MGYVEMCFLSVLEAGLCSARGSVSTVWSGLHRAEPAVAVQSEQRGVSSPSLLGPCCMPVVYHFVL